MADLGSQYLSASAGSGKTFALSKRFCQLVMAGAAPESICALTFTRAATREIFAAVVERLLNHDVEEETGWLSDEAALERILEALPRLQIATIDAFSAKVARLFAYELGLSPDFSLYDEGGSPEAKEALRETVRRALRATTQRSGEELLRLFDVRDETNATVKSLSERLQTFVTDFGELARQHPKGWGNLAAFQDVPEPCEDREALVQILREVGTAGVSDKHAKAFSKLIEVYHPEVDSIRAWKALHHPSGACEKLKTLAETGAFTYYRKELRLNDDEWAAAQTLWNDLIGRDLEQTAQHTRLLYDALVALNRSADERSSETGQLTFNALTATLAKRLGDRLSVLDEQAMYVAYRMDTAVRHLMIDEFQDTSVTQWQVLSNLAQELWTGERTTFFYVGDVKQSIYGWRGGDVSLFGDTRRVPDVPAGKPLVESYRSRKAIIDFVNRAFDIPEDLIHQAEPWQRPVLSDWRARWQRHVAKRAELGYARCVAVEGDRIDLWLQALADCIAMRWRELAGKQLHVALLARKNDTLGKLQVLLAHRGVPCALDGKMTVNQTAMGQLVRALLLWLAAPTGTLWGEVVRRLHLADADNDALLAGWNRRIVQEGYASWLAELFKNATELTEEDTVALAAIRQCFEGVDDVGGLDPTEVIAQIESLEIPCAADADMLTLMTIHRSKGLTFDVVFTVLSGEVGKDRSAAVMGEDWVLEAPALSATTEAIEPIHHAIEEAKAARYRDDLCVLYVALTRARYEQQVFAPAKELGKSDHAPWFIFKQCGGTARAIPECEGASEVCALGDPDWWTAMPDRKPKASVETCDPWERIEAKEKPETELPSERSRTASVADLLAEGADTARLFGISEHDRLAAIDWTDTPPCFPEVFRRPDEPCDLWRERAFAVTVEGHRSVGQFDRVHIFPKSRRAVIYDFKTGHAPVVSDGYRAQMLAYRRALAALTGFAPHDIRLVLLFTRCGQAVEVTDA